MVPFITNVTLDPADLFDWLFGRRILFKTKQTQIIVTNILIVWWRFVCFWAFIWWWILLQLFKKHLPFILILLQSLRLFLLNICWCQLIFCWILCDFFLLWFSMFNFFLSSISFFCRSLFSIFSLPKSDINTLSFMVVFGACLFFLSNVSACWCQKKNMLGHELSIQF